jgi:hypothetical protein
MHRSSKNGLLFLTSAVCGIPYIEGNAPTWSRLLVTLSKRGIEPLRLCNTVYFRARRTSVSGVNPNGRQKMPAFFEGMGISFDTAIFRSLGYQ